MAYADRHTDSTEAFTLNGVTNAANTVFVWSPFQRSPVHRVGLRQVAGSTVSAVITLLKYAGTVSASIGTITLPNSNTLGVLYYLDKSAAPVVFLPGDVLAVQAPTGFSAGATTASVITIIETDLNDQDLTTAPTNAVLVTA